MSSEPKDSCPGCSGPSCQTPRVETLIDRYQTRFPGTSKSALARYFEEVHQGLAPLARDLELENQELRAQIEQMKATFQAQFRNGRAASPTFEIEPQLAGRVSTEPCLRAMVRAYYATRFESAKAEQLAEEYFREVVLASTR